MNCTQRRLCKEGSVMTAKCRLCEERMAKVLLNIYFFIGANQETDLHCWTFPNRNNFPSMAPSLRQTIQVKGLLTLSESGHKSEKDKNNNKKIKE